MTVVPITNILPIFVKIKGLSNITPLSQLPPKIFMNL